MLENHLENHLEYIRRIKNSGYNFKKLNFTTEEAFRAACDLIEADAEDYERLIKHKLRVCKSVGVLIGIGIAMIVTYFYILYKF